MPLSGGNYSTARAAQRKGAFDARFLAPGTNAFIGKIQVDLAGLEAPQALKLVATVASGQSVVAANDWNRNYRLGLIFECRVGSGKLMVCSADLETNLAQRPSARQLRRSLVAYMAGAEFNPACEVATGILEQVLFDNLIMRRLGAVVRGSGPVGNLIDGDPNTFWLAGGRGVAYPHEITIEFPNAIAMSGLLLMPRQNLREHEGDIRDYAITTSADGSHWTALTRGTLVSTFDPQRVVFPGTVSTRFLRFRAVSGFGADGTAALGELAVIYAGPKLAVGKSAAPEFKRARSASEDVDEGPPNQ